MPAEQSGWSIASDLGACLCTVVCFGHRYNRQQDGGNWRPSPVIGVLPLSPSVRHACLLHVSKRNDLSVYVGQTQPRKTLISFFSVRRLRTLGLDDLLLLCSRTMLSFLCCFVLMTRRVGLVRFCCYWVGGCDANTLL